MSTERTPLTGASSHVLRRPRARRVIALVTLAAIAVGTTFVMSEWLLNRSSSKQTKDGANARLDPDTSVFCESARYDAGYIRLPHKQDDHYFYWYIESRNTPSTAPLVLWLTGGPGCSSLATLLQANGPCHVNHNDYSTTVKNPFSWTNFANVIWLDQPTNVGFSYGTEADMDHNEDDVQVNIYWFLQHFLDRHPELAGRELFIAGESYGGHYVPAAAHYIWSQNKKLGHREGEEGNKTHYLNLQGITIGNGLVNPVVQSEHGLDMVNNSYNITLLDSDALAAAKAALPICTQLVKACQTNNASACLDGFNYCQTNVLGPMTLSHRNPYDIRGECFETIPDLCYDLTNITKYLNSESVKKFLHVKPKGKEWQSCSMEVMRGFAFDMMKRFDQYIAEMLDDIASVRVLIYHGDADLMCNWSGGLAWLQELQWSHQAEFNATQVHPFIHNTTQQAVGQVWSYKTQVTFVRVFEAGHFVPLDQPEVALEMITKFLKSEPM